MRVLGAIRRSKHGGADDPSTSPEVQRSAVESAVGAKNIIDWAVDLSVSAWRAGDPFNRPELGQWLKTPERFDAIAWLRLDRAVRNMNDLHKLAAWATDYRKALIFASGPAGGKLTIDMGNGPMDAMTQLILTILAFAAQMEGQAISERWKGTKAYLRAGGKYSGGDLPYWLKAVGERGRKEVVLNPDSVPVMEEIIDRVLRGESQRSICADLTTRGVPSPRGTKWVGEVTARMLRSPLLVGRMVHNGEVVRKNDGSPLEWCEPLLEMDRYNALQTALDRAARPKERPRNSDARLLTKVQYCAICGGGRVYRAQKQRRGETDVYSECNNHRRDHRDSDGNKICGSFAVRADQLEELVSRAFLDLFSDAPIYRTIQLPAESHVTELKEAEEALAWLVEEAATKGPAVRKLYEKQIADREATIERLSALPELPARVERVPTGQTYGEVWAQSAHRERRLLLVDGGYRVYTAPYSESFTEDDFINKLSKGMPPAGQWWPGAPFALLLAFPVDVAEKLGAEGWNVIMQNRKTFSRRG